MTVYTSASQLRLSHNILLMTLQWVGRVNPEQNKARNTQFNLHPAQGGCWLESMTGIRCSQIDQYAVIKSPPPPGISLIHTLPHTSETWNRSGVNVSSRPSSSVSGSTVLRDVHVPARLMEDFLNLASDNTSKDLETCGVLGAFLNEGTFYVTMLIIPKQESTSSSCQALNEEEIFAIQNENALFPVGWIHTHPSQSCFMSSVDLHTQYSYQVMVPEAVGIVMAPTDKTRDHGIFRLSASGMMILKECRETGFHPHREPADGNPLYEECSNVHFNPYMRLEICDFRC